MYITSLSRKPAGTWSTVSLAVILIASLALRLLIVKRGGQYYWPDESRFGAALQAVEAFSRRDFHFALGNLFSAADHLGFKLAALLPAWGQIELGLGSVFPAAFFSLFPVGSIALLWLIAKRAGATEGEAFGSALAFACSNSMFYWSRHLVPYDLAIFWSLIGLYIALKTTPHWYESLLIGILGFIAFITYSGYWTLVLVVILGHVLLALPSWRTALGRAVWAGGGMMAATSALLFVTKKMGFNLFASFRGFAGAVNQGNFNDGHRMIAAYLWNSEGVILLVWISAILGLFGAVITVRPVAPRAWFCFGAIVAIVLSLVLASNVLGKFVVYGRLVRQIIPFCALLTGYINFNLLPKGKAQTRTVIVLTSVLILGAAWNFYTPLSQEFPAEFRARALAIKDEIEKHAARDGMFIDPNRWRILWAQHIYPAPIPQKLPAHRELVSAHHPLQYRPYLYEGFTSEQRDAFLQVDIRMRLILTDSDARGTGFTGDAR